MTEEEWLICGSRNQMRSCINSRPRRPIRWLLFNLACLERVRDLVTDERCLQFIRALEEYAIDGDRLPFRSFSREEAAVRETVRNLWQLRDDPLRDARIAAARAVLAARLRTFDTSEMVAVAFGRASSDAQEERRFHCRLLRDIFGNPFRPVHFSPDWRTDTAVALARTMYEAREFGAMPILADALQDAGCDDEHILSHCRDGNQPHVRGCWVVDLVLGKE